MPTPTITVEVAFPTTAMFSVFVLDDPTKGKLDNVTYKLAGADTVVDLTDTVTAVSVRRGRTRPLDRFEPGSCTITIRDTTGAWNPQNTSSPYYPNVQVRRPVRVTASLNGVGYALFTGLVQSYRYDYEKSGKVATVTLEAADILSQFSQVNVTTVAGSSAGQLSGARINNILDTLGGTLATTARTVDAGRTTLQADPATLRSGLDAIQQVVDSELGAFFVKADGTIRYADRGTVISESQQTQATFNANGSSIAYLDVGFAFDDTLLTNDCTVTPNGLAAQTASNTASQDSFGKRSVTRTGFMSTTADALEQAKYLVGLRGTPALRADSLTLDTFSGEDQAVQALSLDLLDAITINHVHTGTAMTFGCAVQGVDHDITPGSWRTRLRLTEAFTGFVLDWSKLDTGVLTY